MYSAAQASAYIDAELARSKAINVDDFAKEDYVGGKKPASKSTAKKVTKKKTSKKKTTTSKKK